MSRPIAATEPVPGPAPSFAEARSPAEPAMPGPPLPAVDVAAAMNRVLAAERAAQQAVEAAKAEAQQILADARRRAREQLEQAERLAQLVHGRAERVAGERAERLRATVTAARVPDTQDSGKRVAAAVARLAERLTRGGDG